MGPPSAIEQIKSIVSLPFVVVLIIPTLLILFIPDPGIIPYNKIRGIVLTAAGILMLLIGSILFVHSIIIIVIIGSGTLAPWNPAKKLVVKGLYRHMRNPMISGVVFILISESIFFRSSAILIWAVIFFLLNHLYFIYKEEPDLLKRFGDEYKEYVQNVPRWLPRLKGWKPEMN